MMQTGALLSSTGYQVVVDGVAVHTQFDAASGAESGAAAKGMKAGQTIADKVGKQTKAVALVVVAGRNCPGCWRNLLLTLNVQPNDYIV